MGVAAPATFCESSSAARDAARTAGTAKRASVQTANFRHVERATSFHVYDSRLTITAARSPVLSLSVFDNPGERVERPPAAHRGGTRHSTESSCSLWWDPGALRFPVFQAGAFPPLVRGEFFPAGTERQHNPACREPPRTAR